MTGQNWVEPGIFFTGKRKAQPQTDKLPHTIKAICDSPTPGGNLVPIYRGRKPTSILKKAFYWRYKFKPGIVHLQMTLTCGLLPGWKLSNGFLGSDLISWTVTAEGARTAKERKGREKGKLFRRQTNNRKSCIVCFSGHSDSVAAERFHVWGSCFPCWHSQVSQGQPGFGNHPWPFQTCFVDSIPFLMVLPKLSIYLQFSAKLGCSEPRIFFKTTVCHF